MPVWMGLKNRDLENHSTAFLAIIDTSASMRCLPEGCPSDKERMWGPVRKARGPRVTKMDLAKQALINLLPAMKEMDYFGILGGRVSPYWEVEPGSLESRNILSEVEAEIKHVVVLVNTDDVHERRIFGLGTLDDMVHIIEGDNISVSFIGIGSFDDEYVPLLNRLASSLGAYLYLTSDVSEIPTFLVDDRKKLSRHQIIRKHLLTQFSGEDFLSLESTPPLEGQFIPEAKTDARTLIWSELGYPVFALRTMGRGTVAALATDGGGALAPEWIGEDTLPLWDGIFASLLTSPIGEERVFFSRSGGAVDAYYTRGRKGAFRKITAAVQGEDSRSRFEAVLTVTENVPAETVHTVPAVDLPEPEEPAPPVPKRWLRMLLIMAAACAVLYEIVRQR
jgi:hypothetical protein